MEDNKYERLLKFKETENGEMSVKIIAADGSDELVLPDKYEGKKVTTLNDPIAGKTLTSIKKLHFGKYMKTINDERSERQISYFKLEEINIPKDMDYLPDFLLDERTPNLKAFKIDKDNKYFKIIGNCLVDLKNKTLLCFLNDCYIPEVKEIENISEFAFTKIMDRNYFDVFIPKTIKHISDDIFNKNMDFLNIEVDKDNKFYTSEKGYLYEIETKTMMYVNDDRMHLDFSNDDVYRISKFAFNDKFQLMEVKLPKTLKMIENYAFCNCINLKKLDVPDSVIFFGTDALKGLDSLKELTLSKNMITNVPEILENCESIEVVNYGDYVLDGTYPIIVTEGGKLPEVIDKNVTYYVKGKHLSKLEIPSYVTGVIISGDLDAEIDEVVIKGHIENIIFDDDVHPKSFKIDEKSNLAYKDGLLYDKYKQFAKLVFVKDKETYTLPKEALYYEETAFYVDKKVRKIIVPKEVKYMLLDDIVSVLEDEKNLEFEILNPNINFEFFEPYIKPVPLKIKLDVKSSKKYIEDFGFLIRKKDKKPLFNTSTNYIKFRPEGYNELKKLTDEGTLKIEGKGLFIHKKFSYDYSDEEEIIDAFTNEKLYFSPEQKAFKFEDNILYCIKYTKDVYVKLPCKLPPKFRKEIYQIVYDKNKYNRNNKTKFYIGKDIKPEQIECLRTLKFNDGFDAIIDKDNKYMKLENGVFIDENCTRATYIIKEQCDKKIVNIPEGVSEIKLETNNLKIYKNIKLNIPKTVKKISFGGEINYSEIFDISIDENNKYFYVKDNLIIEKETNLPILIYRSI